MQTKFPPDKRGSIWRMTHRRRRFDRILKQRARIAREQKKR